MKDKIIELLKKYEDVHTQGVYRCDYDEIAQDIVKLFAIPDVSVALPLDNGKPWPTKDVLTQLIWATEYLLNDNSFDGHGHEELNICLNRGKEILKEISGNDR